MLPSIDKSKLSLKGKLENVFGIHLKTQKQQMLMVLSCALSLVMSSTGKLTV
jgi:hypothetical protein